MTFEDLNYGTDDWKDYSATLKEQRIELGKRFTDLTLCVRVYSLAYSHHGILQSIWIGTNESSIFQAKGYTEVVKKRFVTEHLPPGPSPFDVKFYLTSSAENLETTKSEWSYMRKAEND